MVCVACLLPLFLIPVVNALPLLFHFILVDKVVVNIERIGFVDFQLKFISKIYGLFGWEYRKPVRTPPTCPFRPASGKSSQGAIEIQNPHTAGEPVNAPSQEDIKQD